MNKFDFDYAKFCCERITQIRMARDISARELSLDLLQSESYINKIENYKTLPSMKSIFSICEYFNITPQDFFSTDFEYPALIREIEKELFSLDDDTLMLLLELIKKLKKSASAPNVKDTSTKRNARTR